MNLEIRDARYTDDFMIVSDNKECLLEIIPSIKNFLKSKLKLELHPDKISIRKFRQGIDFLGYCLLPKYRLLRTKTKKRIYKKLRQRTGQYKEGLIDEYGLRQSLNSYLGVLSHADTFEFQQELKNQFWFWLKE